MFQIGRQNGFEVSIERIEAVYNVYNLQVVLLSLSLEFRSP